MLRLLSQKPLANVANPANTERTPQTVVVYQPYPQPVATQQTTTVIQSTQSTQAVATHTEAGGDNINVNVNIGTSSSASSGVQSSSSVYYEETVVTETTVINQPAATPAEHYVMPGYNGPIGCPWPMSDADFQAAKQTIASKDFEDSKLQIARQVFNSNCLTSAQVRDIMLLFDFEDSKLDFAKYAYGRTYDVGNYYKVNDAFEFESSIDELNNYINTRR